ncbi:ankyrin repeat domain-containing protein [Candidatus Mesenet endosymbiont of Agriotes lineatus]|uniref:ankyrin repeat domain-containing protein n=1 Tax=Candidatus Mesenet endosymbiont of Agriotes lineatus TaxID=3077948 RepID=UPI0030CACF02
MGMAEYNKYYNDICQVAHNSDLNKQELSYVLNKILTKYDITLDTKNQYDNTFLHCAIYNRDIHTTTFLIEEGADIHMRGYAGFTPIHLAAANNDIHIINLLAGRDACPNEEDHFGCTPLHIAAFYGNLETIELLVTALEVDINEVNDGGHTITSCCFQ